MTDVAGQPGLFFEQADTIPEGSHRYRPNPEAVIEAVQLHQPFVIAGREGAGVMRGRPGDYLIRGTDGELYLCRREVFVQKYVPA